MLTLLLRGAVCVPLGFESIGMASEGRRQRISIYRQRIALKSPAPYGAIHYRIKKSLFEIHPAFSWKLLTMISRVTWTACLASLFCTAVMAEDKVRPTPKVITPTEKIELLNGKDFTGWYTWEKDTGYEDPRQIFTYTPEGILRISGDGWGGLTTNDEYHDYHLVMEYRWGTETHQSRVKAARDSGILVHCIGDDGTLGASGDKKGPWMASIECQIIEGGVGDILVLPTTNFDGTKNEVHLTVEATRDRDGEPIYKKGAPEELFHSARINWWGRDEDWQDVVGFRGKHDVDSPGQEWTTLEVYAKGDELTYVVNGIVVNRATKCVPSKGKLLVQTECAEMFVRKFDLLPLPESIPE